MSAREGAPTELPLSMKTKSPESFLFTSLLKLVLGEQAAYVFGILLDHKRLTLPQLQKLCKMKLSAVKKSLVSLLQLECAVYFEETNFITDKSQTYYSSSFSGCYKFLYANAIINDIHRDYGELHAAIVQQVLVNGHLTIGEYLKNVDGAARAEETERAFSILVIEKWLIPIDELHFQSKYDLFHKAYHQQTAIFNAENKGKAISQAKKLQVIKEETRRKHQQLMSEDKVRSQLFQSDSNSMFPKVNPEIPLTFSLNRYLKRLRSLHFASEARHKVGEISSRLYAVILNRLEAKSAEVDNPELRLEKYLANVGQSGVGLDPRVVEQVRGRYELKDQERGMNITVSELYKELLRNGEKFGVTVESVKNTIADPSLEFGRKRKNEDSNGFPGAKKVKIEVDEVLERLGSHDSDDENENDDPDNPDPRIMSTLLQHLKLLASDPKFPFLIETDMGQFHVPYTRLSPILAKHVFKQYVKAIIGPDALKVLNCIEDKRLADEKAVSKLVLMKEASVRNILSRLLKFNIIELQEIPKTQDRSAMRSVYAFRFRPQPAIEMFKKSILFNMGEVLEKLEHYKKQNKILLDKVNREDVKGREQELLLPSELKQLEQYYEYESTWITKFGRLRTAIDVFEFLTT
ncbi:hypothetical protein KL933_003719 [Ogataea haglerorum]|uniref:DNA-directed RNA polymerase III subunit RPC3 n=1 Tax=Ogataea haglerorum TaxID=1937702 RepID=A0AAN6D3N8_9ASCO|nr:hypothetical protein KL950_003897 [Ogataea haglerorum]KAG7716669.1 hypothetical protein KL913_003185 [Ogataea haglerorum]KAG7717578.1 hypothetical protein KL949_003412 [Ogataea haglerorum]KAG7726277.1 hypothetical protein KL933_003719 [Ogataea haglerorum]KAG7737069.1 hypothetical protein KL923_004207 [Ogataea haglerorum]